MSLPTPGPPVGSPQPSAAPEPAPDTGDEELDQALASLADLAGSPVHEHPERLAAVHAVLQWALEPDGRPGSTRA